MNILVTLNSNYINPLKTMLWSLFFNNPGQNFEIYLMHSSISDGELEDISNYVKKQGQKIHGIKVPEESFKNAPVVLHYPKEMYYRLLAYKYLPGTLERILYLDPDILVINPIHELYDTDMNGYLYAAAYHELLPVREINKLRLKTSEMKQYYNSGVLLMNLELQREKIRENEIHEFIERYKSRLFLPDQDVLNSLYCKDIKNLDEIKYNYNTRFFKYYKILSGGEINMDYIMKNTVILHFCGKKKPWQKNYSGKFHALYKHYESLALKER